MDNETKNSCYFIAIGMVILIIMLLILILIIPEVASEMIGELL